MWQKFLKKEQGPFLVPPNFKAVRVKSHGKQVFNINLRSARKNWVWVNDQGKTVRQALPYEIEQDLDRYPNILCAFVKAEGNSWIASVNNALVVVRNVPEAEILPMTRFKATILGTVLLFRYFDLRDAKPWLVDEANVLLKKEDLPDKAPVELVPEQRFVFDILLEHEKTTRVPQTERQVKDILNKEGAELINLRETGSGYKISFRYKGSTRNVDIKEDLMLTNAGMCLSGGDRNYSLESFLSILHNRGRYDHWHDDEYDY